MFYKLILSVFLTVFSFNVAIAADTIITDAKKTIQMTFTDKFTTNILETLKESNKDALIGMSSADSKAFISAQYRPADGMSSKDAHEKYLNNMNKAGKLRIVSDEKIKIGSAEAYKASLILQVGELNVRYIMVDYVLGSRSYLLMGWCLDTDYTWVAADMDKVLMSFKVLK